MFDVCMDVESFFNALPIPIIIFDKDIEIININERVYRLDPIKINCIGETIKTWLLDDLNDFKEEETKEISFEKSLEIRKDTQYFKVQCKKICDKYLNLKNIIVILNDITSYKKTEITIKKKKRQFCSMLQNMPIMMDVMDEENNIILWNKECERVTGYLKDDIVNNDSIWEKLYPDKDYREKVIKPIKEKDCDFRDLEYDLVCKDGSIKTVSWFNISKRFPIDGWYSWAFGIDMTNRKNTEYRLRKKTEELKKIFEALPDMYCRIDKKGNILDCRSSNNSDFNINTKECIGDSIINLVPKDAKLFFHKTINKVLKTNTLIEKEFFINKNGERKFYESRVIPLTKDEIIMIIRDISKRKIAQEALKDSEIRYRTFFNICPELIYLIDMTSNIITDANPAFLRKFLIDRNDIGRVKITDFVDAYSLENFQKLKLKLLNRQGSTGIHFIVKDIKGNTFPVEVNCVPIIKDGIVEKILCCARDISEREKIVEIKKNAQKNKKLLNEAKQYEKLRTEFFANISHEFRTPINVILGAIQLMGMYLKDMYPSKELGKTIKMNKSIKQNCYRLIRLVNNLIDITRIDSEFLQLNLKNCDIVKIIKDITDSVYTFVDVKDLNLVFNSDVDELIIACDPDKIERILLNLLSNAIKFTKEGDKIVVGIKNEEDGVIISVKDSGIGIKKENLKIIFERFRQVDKSFIRDHEGSGIGLSLVKMLVEMHGGTIDVNSIYKKGSEFIIKLPNRIIKNQNNIIDCKTIESDKVEKVAIEFSDIYF